MEIAFMPKLEIKENESNMNDARSTRRAKQRTDRPNSLSCLVPSLWLFGRFD